MKKILIIGLVLLIIFVIYLSNLDKKVYYLALGDSLETVIYKNKEVYGYSYYVKKHLKDKNILERYSDDFSKVDTRITDIISDINNNTKIVNNKGSFSFKNALIKADLVTINISNSDVYDKLASDFNNEIYDYIDDLAYDLDNLFKLMREYCKEDIIMIGVYNPFEEYSSDVSDVLEYLNNKYYNVCKEYDITYLDIMDLSLSNDFYKKIGFKTIALADKKLFEAWFLFRSLLQYIR